MEAQHNTHQAVILPEGTLEDTLSDQLIADTLNHFYDPPEPLRALDIDERRNKGRHDNRTLSALEALFKDWELASSRKGSHKERQFDKVDFAYHVAQTLLTQSPTVTTNPVSQSLVAFIYQAVMLSQQNILALSPPTEHE
jgi:hypothetical protein